MITETDLIAIVIVTDSNQASVDNRYDYSVEVCVKEREFYRYLPVDGDSIVHW